MPPPNLGFFPSCEPSFLRSAFVTWVDFLGANSCAPITSHSPWGCIYLSLVSCMWFSPGHGPLMGRICPRASQQWRGYFTSQVYPLLVLEFRALKPPFSSPCYCSELSRPEASLRCLSLVFCLGDAFTWRCFNLEMPFLGDALARRRSLLATR